LQRCERDAFAARFGAQQRREGDRPHRPNFRDTGEFLALRAGEADPAAVNRIGSRHRAEVRVKFERHRADANRRAHGDNGSRYRGAQHETLTIASLPYHPGYWRPRPWAPPCDANRPRGIRAPRHASALIGFHTSERLASEAVNAFAQHGLDVAVNRPYSGALVPARCYRRDDRVAALMIEINRRLYMDEATGEKLATFAETAALVESVLTTLLDVHETSRRRDEQ
jgi:hypothetical protein